MRSVTVWIAFMLAYSSSPFAFGVRYIDPISAQSENSGDIAEKRIDLNEPTCEQLKAMWRYNKRQNRAAKTTTGYPIYPDPFPYTVWKSYAERAKSPLTYRGKFVGRPRNRVGGSAPIYGRMVHKAPAGSRLRNGMRHSPRPYDKIPRLYGTINSYPPSSRRRVTSYRAVGGGSPPLTQLPQAGSFQLLRELLQAEREQQKADEFAKKRFIFKEPMADDQLLNIQRSRKQFVKPTLQIPTKMNYGFGQGRYTSNVSNIGQAWSRSEPQSRGYMLH